MLAQLLRPSKRRAIGLLAVSAGWGMYQLARALTVRPDGDHYHDLKFRKKSLIERLGDWVMRDVDFDPDERAMGRDTAGYDEGDDPQVRLTIVRAANAA